jgi:hypothetical protein
LVKGCVVNSGQTGSTGQPADSGGGSDWRTWGLGVASAGLAGLVVLAVEKEQWVWVLVAVAVTVTIVMFLKQLQNSGNAKMALGFLAVGVVLGLVATVGVLQLRKNPENLAAGPPESRGSSPSTESASNAPQDEPDEFSVTFDTPADMESVPITGTVASGTVKGPLPSGSSMWLVKFSADNGGRHFVTRQIVPTAGRWSAPTEQIGSDDASENGRTFALQVVIASAAASQAMTPSGATREQGFAKLPAGAKVIAERTIVRR